MPSAPSAQSTSPSGFAASARARFRISPVPASTKLTLMPVFFSNIGPMAWTIVLWAAV